MILYHGLTVIIFGTHRNKNVKLTLLILHFCSHFRSVFTQSYDTGSESMIEPEETDHSQDLPSWGGKFQANGFQGIFCPSLGAKFWPHSQ